VPIKLHGRHLRPLGPVSQETLIGRICEFSGAAAEANPSEILLLRCQPSSLPDGFKAYLLCEETGGLAKCRDAYVLATELQYLSHGDVVRIDPSRCAINVLYRRNSPSNTLLVTERCDSRCLMCSQPPRTADDGWILDELRTIVPLISAETRELGITGGEPGLLGERLAELLLLLKAHLPTTAVHVLSNGRAFADRALSRTIADVHHPDLMFGVPLYSDLPEAHDYVVQARGAFSETVRGILNLKQLRVRVELRFVVHAETWERLPEFARFVARNLVFVDHVALMGLELVGFARTNLDRVWIDPLDYQDRLAEAVRILSKAGTRVSIYNHQLCVLDERLHGFARRSISDWKNLYMPECDGCAKRSECGGFFASSMLRRSRGIQPIAAAE
jgi:His-Xaa-Ser system radical SAM maturase HxsC